MFSVCIHV
ncbi:UNVERIFIED_CONTAM: hypothetical protein GTU68_056737 [Idotea baltica]|nr:hypothetical protein [Idotea baltica]